MSEMDVLSKMFDMHIQHCKERDELSKSNYKEIRDMFKGIWDAHDEMRKTVTSLQIRAALAVGGLIVLLKVADYVIAILH